jgi:hypothetical protein
MVMVTQVEKDNQRYGEEYPKGKIAVAAVHVVTLPYVTMAYGTSFLKL